MRYALVMAITLALTDYASCAEEVLQFFGGEGATRCSKWIEEHRDNASILAFGLDGWLMGFVSGLEHGTSTFSEAERKAFFAEMTEADVLNRTNDFCRGHPDAYMIQAALTVTADLFNDFAKRIRTAIEKAKRATPKR
jgi:hypothetical protein